MNNFERKAFIVTKILEGNASDIFEALQLVGGDIAELEGIPFGSRNRVNEISMDFVDGKLNSSESLRQLREFIQSIPDSPSTT